MKKSSFAKLTLVALVAGVVLVGCKQKTSNQPLVKADVEVFDVNPIKDRIIAICKTLPIKGDIEHVATNFNATGVSYVGEISYPSDQIEKMMTSSQSAFGAGIYTCDLAYAAVFRRQDKVGEYSALVKQLVPLIGVDVEALEEGGKNMDKLQQHIEDVDSIDAILGGAVYRAHDRFSATDRPDLYAYIMIGANVELLYILAEQARIATYKAGVMEFLNANSERALLINELLTLMKEDPTVTPIYDAYQPVAQMFQVGQISESQVDDMADTLRKIRDGLI